MDVLVSIPAGLSLLLLAAHFLRSGSLPLAAACVLALALLAARRIWAVRVLQVLLLLGALEWVRTMMLRIDDYETSGRDWTRMVVILSSVAGFTFLSMLLLFCFSPRRGRDQCTPEKKPARLD